MAWIGQFLFRFLCKVLHGRCIADIIYRHALGGFHNVRALMLVSHRREVAYTRPLCWVVGGQRASVRVRLCVCQVVALALDDAETSSQRGQQRSKSACRWVRLTTLDP
jgi:hypothetical protein